MASQAIDIEIAFLQAQIRRAFAMDDFGTTGKLRRELKLRLAQRERLLLPYETGKAMAMSAAAKRIGAPAGWAKSMAGSGAFADPNAPAACVQQLRSHTNIVWRCRFAPSSADAEVSSNQLIATVSDDKTVKVWSTMLARCVATLTGHKKMVTDCSIARGPAEGADVVGGRMLIASASADGTVRVWEQQRALREDDGAANAAAVDDKDAAEDEKDAQGGSSDGVGGDGVEENEMCDAHSIGIEVEEEVDPDALFHCALTLRGHRGGVKCCAFARPDAETPRLIASGGDDATVRLWRMPDGVALKVLRMHTAAVRCVAFNRAATLLASGGNDAAVHLWRLQAPPAKPPSTAAASVRQVVESVRESLSFLDPPEATMRLRSLVRTSRGAVDWGHAEAVLSCQFSFDDRVLATTSQDRTTCLWRCDGALTALTPLGAPLAVPKHALLRKLVGHKNSVTDVSFSPDSLLVLTASLDETVRLWRVDDGLVVKTLVGHTDGVCGVSFHADGTLAVSSGMDNTLRVWDVSPYARAPLAVTSGAKRGSKSLLRYRPTGPAPAHLERTLRAGSTQRVAVVGGVRNLPPPGTAATRLSAAASKVGGGASKLSAAASKQSLSK